MQMWWGETFLSHVMKKDFQEFSLGIHVGQMEPGSVSSADFEGQSAVRLFPGSFPKLWTAGVDASACS